MRESYPNNKAVMICSFGWVTHQNSLEKKLATPQEVRDSTSYTSSFDVHAQHMMDPALLRLAGSGLRFWSSKNKAEATSRPDSNAPALA
jgi:hypothetical protein